MEFDNSFDDEEEGLLFERFFDGNESIRNTNATSPSILLHQLSQPLPEKFYRNPLRKPILLVFIALVCLAVDNFLLSFRMWDQMQTHYPSTEEEGSEEIHSKYCYWTSTKYIKRFQILHLTKEEFNHWQRTAGQTATDNDNDIKRWGKSDHSSFCGTPGIYSFLFGYSNFVNYRLNEWNDVRYNSVSKNQSDKDLLQKAKDRKSQLSHYKVRIQTPYAKCMWTLCVCGLISLTLATVWFVLKVQRLERVIDVIRAKACIGEKRVKVMEIREEESIRRQQQQALITQAKAQQQQKQNQDFFINQVLIIFS